MCVGVAGDGWAKGWVLSWFKLVWDGACWVVLVRVRCRVDVVGVGWLGYGRLWCWLVGAYREGLCRWVGWARVCVWGLWQ